MPKVDRPGVGKHVLLVGQMLAILISHRTSRMDQACRKGGLCRTFLVWTLVPCEYKSKI